MRPLTRSCFLLLVLGRLLLLALSLLLGICLSSLRSPPFSLCALALISLSLSRQGAALAHLNSLSHFLKIWYSGQMALYLFLLAKAGLAYFPTALSMAPSPSFPFPQAQYSQVSLLKPAPFCTLFAGFGSTIKSTTSLLFSYYLTLVVFSPPGPVLHLSFYLKLSFCSHHPVLSSIFPSISNSTADLTGTVFYLLLYYQATMSPRTLVSPGKRRN